MVIMRVNHMTDLGGVAVVIGENWFPLTAIVCAFALSYSPAFVNAAEPGVASGGMELAASHEKDDDKDTGLVDKTVETVSENTGVSAGVGTCVVGALAGPVGLAGCAAALTVGWLLDETILDEQEMEFGTSPASMPQPPPGPNF